MVETDNRKRTNKFSQKMSLNEINAKVNLSGVSVSAQNL
jgi:hypothetical protein